ncbi:hypothetical protein Tco_1095757, partial [Tanacetum coccineum]
DPQLAHSVPHPSLHCGSRYIPLLCEPDVRSCPMGPVSSWKFRRDILIPGMEVQQAAKPASSKATNMKNHKERRGKKVKVITDGTWNSLVESASIPVLAEFRAPWRALPDDSSSC